MRKLFDIASICVLALATAGLAVRFTVRDALPATAWIYYFVGVPAVLAVLLAAGAGLSICARRFRRFAIAAVAAVAVAGGWWNHAYYDNPCAIRTDSVRIVSWNVSRLRAGRERVAAELADLGPDIAFLVEAGNNNAEAWTYWRERFPGYEVALPGGGLLAIVRGTIEATSFREMTGISSFVRLDIVANGRPLRIAGVDLDASPRFDKRRLVPRVFQLATAEVDRPLVVAGDFNTPVDSPAFAAARERFRHAFEAAGRGLLATWPTRYPVTAIDHVWTGPGVLPFALLSTPATSPTTAQSSWMLSSNRPKTLPTFATPHSVQVPTRFGLTARRYVERIRFTAPQREFPSQSGRATARAER